jgi:hypothetical protein
MAGTRYLVCSGEVVTEMANRRGYLVRYLLLSVIKVEEISDCMAHSLKSASHPNEVAAVCISRHIRQPKFDGQAGIVPVIEPRGTACSYFF